MYTQRSINTTAVSLHACLSPFFTVCTHLPYLYSGVFSLHCALCHSSSLCRRSRSVVTINYICTRRFSVRVFCALATHTHTHTDATAHTMTMTTRMLRTQSRTRLGVWIGSAVYLSVSRAASIPAISAWTPCVDCSITKIRAGVCQSRARVRVCVFRQISLFHVRARRPSNDCDNETACDERDAIADDFSLSLSATCTHTHTHIFTPKISWVSL